ncbi:MAG: hypothetical protein KatS3mg105_4702 [Gemmatales bacterium]|nr:MAG: hypothetical protein KatS3mg105_4702 [Gemmatales bacterium]
MYNDRPNRVLLLHGGDLTDTGNVESLLKAETSVHPVVVSFQSIIDGLDAEEFACTIWCVDQIGAKELGRLKILRTVLPQMPIIVVARHAEAEQAASAVALGVQEILALESTDRQTLLRAIHCAIKRKCLQDRGDEHLAQLQGIFESALSALVSIDEEQRILLANPAAEKVFGKAASELVGLSLYDLMPKRLHEAHAKRMRTFFDSGEQELRIGKTAKATCLRADGQEFPAEMFITANRTGSRRLFTVVIRDLTDEMRMDETARQSQKLEAIGRLAGGVAHDFNNLLTVIIGYSDMLFRNQELPESARHMIKEIREASNRAATLTRQLLAFSRSDLQKFETIDLNAVVRDVHKMLSRLIGEDIQLIVALEEGVKPIKADRGQIEQVLVNLAVNSRDAMPDGGKLTIETKNVVLSGDSPIDGLAPGNYVLLSISDTGVGMDAETQERIFEPFFTTKEPGRGTGLGLSTVYGIVKQSGGAIKVHSEPNRGTTFEIYFPPQRSVTRTLRRDSSIFPSPNKAETILLVEDEEQLRRIGRVVLESQGYQVLEASCGEEALRISEEFSRPIDLLLTDVVMPHMSGRVVADKITKQRPGIKVLFVSGYTDDAIIRHGVLQQEMPLLSKPYTPSALTRKVREVLESASESAQ